MFDQGGEKVQCFLHVQAYIRLKHSQDRRQQEEESDVSGNKSCSIQRKERLFQSRKETCVSLVWVFRQAAMQI